MREGRLWIDGRWRDGAGWADGIDPRTGEVAYRWAVGDAAAVAEAVEAARRAQPGWAASPWRRRREVLVRALQVTRGPARRHRRHRDAGDGQAAL